MSDFKPRFLKPSETNSLLVDRIETSSLGGETSSTFVYNRFISQNIETQRQRLPIFNNRNHILYLLEKYQTLVLVGETGCGKSTQIPQYLKEAEWPLQVCVCQPRRVAAMSLANRVAEETGTLVQGDAVGYAVRFDACFNKPKIKFVTEGILIREMMSDPLLKDYSVIILDEVHEKTLYTDILMGLLKKILKRRRELRLVVASATMDAKQLHAFFNENDGADVKKDTAVIMTVRGRQFDVDIHYVKDPVPCYIQSTVDTIMKIHSANPNIHGDVLAFLTGQEEVDRCVRLLNEHARNIESIKSKGGIKQLQLQVLPMYAALPYSEQLHVFRRPEDGFRKVVIATNVAETSITIHGIVHVIDCGFVKMKWFNNDTNTDSLVILPISKASANQRAGRAGRTKAGKVYRLYTKVFFNTLSDTTPPEMVRSNLTYVILQLLALGIQNVATFRFPNPPPLQNIKSALEILYALDALDINGQLTAPMGFNMAEFVLDPLLSKILLMSGEFGCSDEILTIISALQIESLYVKPSTGQGNMKARVQKRLFEVEEGDLITYLNVYSAFSKSQSDQEQRAFCQRHYFSYKSLLRMREIRRKLEKVVKSYGIEIISCNGYAETICKCLVTGLFPNAAYLHYSGVYKTIRGDIEINIHPDSVLYSIPQPQWVIFVEVCHTTKLFMRDITVIKSEWLIELAPHFYHKALVKDY